MSDFCAANSRPGDVRDNAKRREVGEKLQLSLFLVDFDRNAVIACA